jgi:hypothetical protein
MWNPLLCTVYADLRTAMIQCLQASGIMQYGLTFKFMLQITMFEDLKGVVTLIPSWMHQMSKIKYLFSCLSTVLIIQ